MPPLVRLVKFGPATRRLAKNLGPRKGPVTKPKPPTREQIKDKFRKIALFQKLQKWKQWHDSPAPFPKGQKKVYLPNFSITLQYNPLVPATHAQFQVPLNFNKFDLRDYLWHTYGVKIHSVRSQVVLQPIRFHTYDTQIPGKPSSYRPTSLKRMTVELDRPFSWPLVEGSKFKATDDFHSRLYDSMAKDEKKQAQSMTRLKDVMEEDEKEAKSLALQKRAKALLDGTLKWKQDVMSKDELYLNHDRRGGPKLLGPDEKISKTAIPERPKRSASQEKSDRPRTSKARGQAAAGQEQAGAGVASEETLGKSQKELAEIEHKRKINVRRTALANSGLRPYQATDTYRRGHNSDRRRATT